MFRSKRFIAIGCAFIIGAIVGASATFLLTHGNAATSKEIRESDIPSSSGYVFTDPLIGLSTSGNVSTSQYDSLEAKVSAYIASQKSNGLSDASVNFRDIGQSDGFIINPDELYDPASLTKVPLMMAYYYLAESDPSILSDKITYSGDPDLDADEQIESPTQMTPGASYSVDEMIDHMILYSDNNAEQLLADHLAATNHLSVLNDLFADLGIKVNTNGGDDTTVNTYSLFLRVLYNATYLDRADSEKALKLLSQTDFTAGIRAGVPATIPIAEKFGDARIVGSTGVQTGAELQNCGLVYYPLHTYLLCIMTKGATIPTLETTIAGISKIIYQDIATRYPAAAQN